MGDKEKDDLMLLPGGENAELVADEAIDSIRDEISSLSGKVLVDLFGRLPEDVRPKVVDFVSRFSDKMTLVDLLRHDEEILSTLLLSLSDECLRCDPGTVYELIVRLNAALKLLRKSDNEADFKRLFSKVNKLTDRSLSFDVLRDTCVEAHRVADEIMSRGTR